MGNKAYIFFDLGWTLEDETDAQDERVSTAAALVSEYGIETTARAIHELQEKGARKMAPSVFAYALSELGLDETQARSVIERSPWNKDRLFLYPDAKQVLETLGKTHFVGLIANQSPGTESRLRTYGILDHFQLVFASAELGLEKPDPRIFELALEEAGCNAEDAWMVGDRLDNDVRPANQAGWHTIRILHGYNTYQQPACAADIPGNTVRELAKIPAIIGRASGV